MRALLLSLILPLIMGIVMYKISFALINSTASNNGNSFTAASQFVATPSATPTPTVPSIVINEIMWNETSSGSADEWIELKNTTSSPIDISNWKVDGLGSGVNSITIPSGTIPANGFFTISNFSRQNSILNIDPDFVTPSVSLANTGEQLVLKNASNTIIDTANQLSGSWFFGSGTSPHASMERKDVPGDGTVSTNWKTATTQANLDAGVADLATPGAAN